MTKRIRRLFVGLAGLALAGSVGPMAWAGCGVGAVKAPASWQSTPGSEASPLLTRVALPATAPSIVGMWSVTFHSGGHIIDFGYAQWHSDGTELMFSGGRPPVTGDVCLGVWAQTGASAYQLNHLALSYDTSGNLNGKANIKEQVTLGVKGNAFTGPFTIDIFDPKTGTLLQHVAGTITGQRVTVTSAP
jgi:hypothetical protein